MNEDESHSGDSLHSVLSLSLSVLAANAQVIDTATCPVPAVQEKFDAAKMNGKNNTFHISDLL